VLTCVARGLARAQAHGAALRGVAWASPVDGQLLASCGDDGAVMLWRPAEGEAGTAAPWTLLATLGGDRARPVLHVAFAPDALLIAAADAAGVVRLYEPADAGVLDRWDLQARVACWQARHARAARCCCCSSRRRTGS
jgi:WD40 repeat protein